MIAYKIQIHLQSERTQYTDLMFTSGDVRAYRLYFSFLSNETAYDITGCGLTVKAKRADGKIVIDSGVVEGGNVAYYDVKSDVYAVAGLLSLEVALTLPDGGYVTTKELMIEVREGYGESGLVAKDTTPILAKLMNQANRAEIAASEAERVAASIAGLGVAAEALGCDSEPTIEKTETDGGILLTFGIPRGTTGQSGADGYTPIRGVDYFTEEDKAAMVTEVLNSLPNGDGVSY